MRFLVFSDSHGNSYEIRQALFDHPEADRILFLGDGERDFNNMDTEINSRPLTMVRGNCDFASLLPGFEIIDIMSHRIYMTHGYAEGVKYGNEMLFEKAEGFSADIILFGHTHEQYIDYIDGINIMNPGSINDGEYGLIDILPGGVVMSGKKRTK